MAITELDTSKKGNMHGSRVCHHNLSADEGLTETQQKHARLYPLLPGAQPLPIHRAESSAVMPTDIKLSIVTDRCSAL